MLTSSLCSLSSFLSAVIPTPSNQHPASDFVSSKETRMVGVGASFSFPFDWQARPGIYDEACRATSEDRVSQLSSFLSSSILTHVDLSIVHEKKKSVDTLLNVQWGHLMKVATLLNRSSAFLHVNNSPNTSYSLKDLFCEEGIANPGSVPDSFFFRQIPNSRSQLPGIPCGLWEVKHSTDSPDVSLRQAFSESTNIAMSHIRAGVAARDVCVPIVSSNGRLIQFALCAMLPPSFPYLVMLTKVLDMSDGRDRKEAAMQLCAIEEMCKKSQVLNAPSGVRFGLSPLSFHLKLTKFIFTTRDTLDQSLLHMFSLLERLCGPEQKKFVLFPLTFRFGEKPEDDALIFEKLDDYRIGLPPDEEARASLLRLIEKAMLGFHECRVVHMDFYPSNIMWRQRSDGAFDLKIIDWDAAHLFDEPYSEAVRDRLEDSKRLALSQEGRDRAHPVVDSVLFDILMAYQTDVRLQSAQKLELDKTFRELCLTYLKEKTNEEAQGGAKKQKLSM